MLLPNHCCHIWLNKYTVWVIVVQQRWITGSQINGGIQNSETQPHETVKRCVTCQKNNDVPAAITPAAHTPAPPGPFRHLQVDYISLPPCKGKTDVFGSNRQVLKMGRSLSNRRALQLHTLLNVLSLISFPDGDYQIALTQIKGTHFTGQVVKEVSRMLKIKWNLHCPYRPQASGQVERSNRTIKTRPKQNASGRSTTGLKHCPQYCVVWEHHLTDQ